VPALPVSMLPLRRRFSPSGSIALQAAYQRPETFLRRPCA
jgi:hypothetical protein